MVVHVSVEDKDEVLSNVKEFEERFHRYIDTPWYSAEISSYEDNLSDLMESKGVVKPRTMTGSHEDFPNTPHHYCKDAEIPFTISFAEQDLDRATIESDLESARDILEEEGLTTEFYMRDTAPEGPFEEPEYALASIAAVEIQMTVENAEANVSFDYSGDFVPTDNTLLRRNGEETELMKNASSLLRETNLLAE